MRRWRRMRKSGIVWQGHVRRWVHEAWVRRKERGEGVAHSRRPCRSWTVSHGWWGETLLWRQSFLWIMELQRAGIWHHNGFARVLGIIQTSLWCPCMPLTRSTPKPVICRWVMMEPCTLREASALTSWTTLVFAVK